LDRDRPGWGQRKKRKGKKKKRLSGNSIISNGSNGVRIVVKERQDDTKMESGKDVKGKLASSGSGLVGGSGGRLGGSPSVVNSPIKEKVVSQVTITTKPARPTVSGRVKSKWEYTDSENEHSSSPKVKKNAKLSAAKPVASRGRRRSWEYTESEEEAQNQNGRTINGKEKVKPDVPKAPTPTKKETKASQKLLSKHWEYTDSESESASSADEKKDTQGEVSLSKDETMDASDGAPTQVSLVSADAQPMDIESEEPPVTSSPAQIEGDITSPLASSTFHLNHPSNETEIPTIPSVPADAMDMTPSAINTCSASTTTTTTDKHPNISPARLSISSIAASDSAYSSEIHTPTTERALREAASANGSSAMMDVDANVHGSAMDVDDQKKAAVVDEETVDVKKEKKESAAAAAGKKKKKGAIERSLKENVKVVDGELGLLSFICCS
jgi:hypothetical protein